MLSNPPSKVVIRGSDAKMSYPVNLDVDVVDGYILERAGVRIAPQSTSFAPYKIDAVVAELCPGSVLEVLAAKLWGNPHLWFKLADANPTRHPSEWTTGDLIRIPLDTVDPDRSIPFLRR